MHTMGAAREETLCLKVSSIFKRDVQKAAKAAGMPSVSEFMRQAMIELAAKHGVKIDRYL